MISSGVRNISVERALRWLQGFLTREWSLLLPVALAFFALPRLTVILVTPRPPQAQTMEEMQAFIQTLPVWWAPLVFGLTLIGIVGAMVLMALAIVPWITVGEAIVLACKRLIVWLALAFAGFGALLLLMTMVLAFGGGQALSVAMALAGFVANALLLTLVLPLIVHRAVGPIAALRSAWNLYHGVFLRIAGALILFSATAWIAGLSIQVSLGFLLRLLARLGGQPKLGEMMVALLVSFVTAVGWSGVYLLVAAFYRQRTGLD